MIDKEIEEIFDLIRGQIANFLTLQTYIPWASKKEYAWTHGWTNYVLGYPPPNGHLEAVEHMFNYWKSLKKKHP